MALGPGRVVPVGGAPVIKQNLQPGQYEQRACHTGGGFFADPPYQPAPEGHGQVKVQQDHHEVDVVTAFSQQKLYDQNRKGKAPVRPVHVFPLPQGDVEQRPHKVGKAYGDQVFLHEVNVMEGPVQGVVAEQPVPRYEKKAGNGKAGEDLEQQEQVQPGGGGSEHKGPDVDPNHSQHGQGPQPVHDDVSVWHKNLLKKL